jgi:glucose-6-phosphate isomerase
MGTTNHWEKFKSNLFFDRQSGLALDLSCLNIAADFFERMTTAAQKAMAAMQALEGGAIANPDEKRMVGHYWLRAPALSPSKEIAETIIQTNAAIKNFAAKIHSGEIAPQKGGKFKYLLVVGIGGSALGPQFVSQALGSPQDALTAFFFDNTDPDGMQKVLCGIPCLGQTLCVVISKSGGTKETRNGQLIAKCAYQAAGLDFSRHFVAITGQGSELDKTALAEKWLARFPMWDWVGGRTSELSAVGLLPAALQGFQIDELLAGAGYADTLTRRAEIKSNPALLLALAWYHAGSGRGQKDMVVLPYKDRLELFSRYLQQLVMESLGKELDLSGQKVNQGLAVYGNKGSTDQHAYVQQLRDGLNNFFAVFVEVLSDSCVKSKLAGELSKLNLSAFEVEPGITCGDYLSGFYQGTRRALYESDRESLSLSIPCVDEFRVGLLIALFERAVGLYASLININAYHQPGVEAGKKAAAAVLILQQKIEQKLRENPGKNWAVEELAQALGQAGETEAVFKIVRHLSANGRIKFVPGESIFLDQYSAK